MSSIFVTYKVPKDEAASTPAHVDAYDGIEYVFPPNERVLVPADAATHMLGFNMPDKSAALVRLGWATKYDDKAKNFVDNPAGAERLKRFVFEKAVMVSESSLAAKHDNARPEHDARNV